MKQLLAILATTLTLAGCASTVSNKTTANAPDLHLGLTQLSSANGFDPSYSSRPVSIQFALTVTNPTASNLTLKRLELSSIGLGAYTLRTGSVPMKSEVGPYGSTTITLTAWAQSRADRLTVNEPVSIRGIARFEDAEGHSFNQIFLQNI